MRRMELELGSYNWDVSKEYESVELIGVSGMRVNALESYLGYARWNRTTVVVPWCWTRALMICVLHIARALRLQRKCTLSRASMLIMIYQASNM